MSDDPKDGLRSKHGPIPPHYWDGEPVEPKRTPEAEAQMQQSIEADLARIKQGQPKPKVTRPE